MPLISLKRLAVLILFSPFLLAAGQEPDPIWTIKRFHRVESLGSRQAVEIKNSHGDVRCRAAAQNEVEILANIQKQENDPYEAEIRIKKDATRLMIEVVYVRTPNTETIQETEQMKKRRVDMTLILPAAAKLEAQTRTGLIEAKGLETDVQANSHSGNIVLSTTGSLQARTERGTIDATLLSAIWSSAPHLETLTGTITMWLPQDTNAIVDAATEGIISTDYSIEIRHQAPGRKKTARAVLGAGAQRLTISSTKGDIRLFRQAA